MFYRGLGARPKSGSEFFTHFSSRLFWVNYVVLDRIYGISRMFLGQNQDIFQVVSVSLSLTQRDERLEYYPKPFAILRCFRDEP